MSFPSISTAAFESPLFWLFVIGLSTILISDFIFIPLAMVRDRLQAANEVTERPLVSIIVPAFNEERTIGNLLPTLLEQSYENMEIIVVNDGSNDGTVDVVREFLQDSRVQILDLPKPNTGKASAINAGIAIANGEIMVTMDADGLIEHNAVMRIVAAMQNPAVSAVAGNVKVANRINVLTRLQALEYIRDINIPRRAFDLMNISIVIPGPLAAFRIRDLQAVGNYDPDTVAEDFDTTIKIHKAKSGQFVVRNLTDAICYTEAPENIHDLIRQRQRWYGGMTQSVLKHADWKFFVKSGTYSSTGVPYIYVTLFAVPLLELLMTVLSIVLAILTGFVWYILAFIIYTILESLTSLLALHLDNEDESLVAYSPAFVLGYRQLLDIIRLYAFYMLSRGRLSWSRANRYGTMQEKVKSALKLK
ncbi:MAG TPA: glycosyltransferase [Candidatus Acidoferrales bacterium]|nr:glycosyltransferase [Candidatus Acidoferrales bacterium]